MPPYIDMRIRIRMGMLISIGIRIPILTPSFYPVNSYFAFFATSLRSQPRGVPLDLNQFGPGADFSIKIFFCFFAFPIDFLRPVTNHHGLGLSGSGGQSKTEKSVFTNTSWSWESGPSVDSLVIQSACPTTFKVDTVTSIRTA